MTFEPYSGSVQLAKSQKMGVSKLNRVKKSFEMEHVPIN